MFGDSFAYKAVLGFVALLGVAAILFSGFGIYTVLTGGVDGAEEPDVLGEFECETFDADPAIAHESPYDVERTVLSPTEIESANGSVTADGGLWLELDVDGELLDASARRIDGSELAVEQVDDETRLVVTDSDPVPFRMWIDSVDEDGTVVRSQLDICVPE